ncbi:Putative Transcription activator of gluconeogenesis ERT1 [Rhizopus microsporus]|nr:Putative Transcription activator of gluconeogenesis ERT1 [Rhizopus microsporus]
MKGSLPTDPQKKPKKKKAARACVHCQKAHLTCDDSRPCQRCIKRDLASTCTDGVRKKAKYLQEDEENIFHHTLPQQQHQQQQQQQQSFYEVDQILSFSSGFSSTTPLEYSMLTNMLGSPHQFLDSASCSSSSSSTIDRDSALLYPAPRKTQFPNVKNPYNYVEGYHYLINYVRER